MLEEGVDDRIGVGVGGVIPAIGHGDAIVEAQYFVSGYTGEKGCEISVPNGSAEKLFSFLVESGAPFGLQPCGLGCRALRGRTKQLALRRVPTCAGLVPRAFVLERGYDKVRAEVEKAYDDIEVLAAIGAAGLVASQHSLGMNVEVLVVTECLTVQRQFDGVDPIRCRARLAG